MAPLRSIRARFSSVFILVLLLVVVLGLFSIWRLEDYHVIVAGIRDRYLPNTQFLGDLNNFTSDFRAAEATALLSSTQSEISANQKDVEQLDRLITLAQHSYEHVPNAAVESRLYVDFAGKWSTYRDTAAKVIALSATSQK